MVGPLSSVFQVLHQTYLVSKGMYIIIRYKVLYGKMLLSMGKN